MNFMKKKHLYMIVKKKMENKINPENYKAKNFSEQVIDAKTGKISN